MIREPATREDYEWLLDHVPRSVVLGDDELRANPLGRWWLLQEALRRRKVPLYARLAARQMGTRGRSVLEGLLTKAIREATKGEGVTHEPATQGKHDLDWVDRAMEEGPHNA